MGVEATAKRKATAALDSSLTKRAQTREDWLSKEPDQNDITTDDDKGCGTAVQFAWDRLPQELRDMIYGLLWQSTPRVKPSFGRTAETFEVYYGTIEKNATLLNELPQWLVINKESLYTGIDQMLRRGEWVFWWNMLGGMDAPVSSALNPPLFRSLTIKSRERSLLRNSNIDGRELRWELSAHWSQRDVASRLALKLSPTLKSLTVDLET